MRFAVASDDQVKVAQHTGRCRGFVVFEAFEQRADKIEWRENTFTHHHNHDGGADCGHHHDHASDEFHQDHSHATLVDALSDCCALVTRGLGPRLVADLAARGVDAYVCDEDEVNAAAEQFAAGKLARAAGTGCCRHG